MNRYRIEITELAEKDLEDAADYIAFQLLNPKAALDTVQGIRAQINKLECFPERNEMDEDPILAAFGVRMDYYRNYKIYYVTDDEKTSYISFASYICGLTAGRGCIRRSV